MAAVITLVGMVDDIAPENKHFFTRLELCGIIGTDNPVVIPATIKGVKMAFVYNGSGVSNNNLASELLRLAKGKEALKDTVLVCRRNEIIK